MSETEEKQTFKECLTLEVFNKINNLLINSIILLLICWFFTLIAIFLGKTKNLEDDSGYAPAAIETLLEVIEKSRKFFPKIYKQLD